MPNALNIAEGC